MIVNAKPTLWRESSANDHQGENGGVSSIVDRVPATRDRFLDLLRVASIAVVIVWHWSLSILYWQDGRIVMPNPITSVPGGWLATWLLQVVPIFFVVGGVVNKLAWDRARERSVGPAGFLKRRLQRLLVPLTVYIACWLVVDVAAQLAFSSYPGVLAYGRVVFTPLWFLAAYVLVVALTPVTANLHQTRPRQTLAALAAIIVTFDIGRFALDVEAFAWLSMPLVWVAIHQLGYFYDDLKRLSVRRALLLAIGAAMVLTIMVAGPYPRSMVSVPGQNFSNMYPTTAALAAVAVLQFGLLIAVRRQISALLQRRRIYGVVLRVNTVILTIFLWHMTAVLIVLAVGRELGVEPLTEPTAQWWLQRPLWVIIPAIVLVVFVAIFGRIETRDRTTRTGATGQVSAQRSREAGGR